MSLVHQGVLIDGLRNLFPKEQPVINSRRESQLRYTGDGKYFCELDVWYPSLNICFEFQDDYHYVTTWYKQDTLRQTIQNDYNKKEVVRSSQIQLIVVPCWWDGSIKSLQNTIHFECPEISMEYYGRSDPIMLNAPYKFFKTISVPDVGELMSASFVTDSPDVIDRNHWWMGEKYDGIRICWHPENSTIYSREGLQLSVYSPCYNFLPRIFIDGEIWCGRGNYNIVLQSMRRSVNSAMWDNVRLIAFDCPSIKVQDLSFEDRYAIILHHSSQDDPFTVIACRFALPCCARLSEFAQHVMLDRGEGVILRMVGSSYEHGRSESLLKFKMNVLDLEGLVTEVGSKGVQIRLPNGQHFTIPSERVHISNIKAGEVVTFSFNNSAFLHQHVPHNAVIYRRKADVNWREGLQLLLQQPTGHFSRSPKFSIDEMRNFLENFARKQRMDPLIPETWRTIKEAALIEHKKGREIIRVFKGYQKAVETLFSEITFDPQTFNSSVKKEDVRRREFERFAQNHQFDPLVASNWYSQSRAAIKTAKGVKEVLAYYGRNVSRALLDLFPEIGLSRSRFMQVKWGDASERRKFFEKYAERNEFDALIPENWYSHSRGTILESKSIYQILKYHGHNVVKALLDLFPEIGLLPSRFKLGRQKWNEAANRRKRFEQYAGQNNFDPFVPENWYSQPRERIYHAQNMRQILEFHGNNVITALMNLFPDIGLIRSNFSRDKRGKRRKQFEQYARQNNFDPLKAENWYALRNPKTGKKNEIRAIVISCYEGSMTRALKDLFKEIPTEELERARQTRKSSKRKILA